jgi:hypothetical protein
MSHLLPGLLCLQIKALLSVYLTGVALFVYRNIYDCCFCNLDAILDVTTPLRAYLNLNRNGRPAHLNHLCIAANQVAHKDRLFKEKISHGDGNNPPPGPLGGHDAARNIHLGHYPATKYVSRFVCILRHRNNTERWFYIPVSQRMFFVHVYLYIDYKEKLKTGAEKPEDANISIR